MLGNHELHGYRDGADWKFKAEDIDRLAAQRASSDSASASDEDGDVLLSEVELGHSDPGLSGTVIGADKRVNPAESDIRLAEGDFSLGSDIQLASSGIELGEEKKPAAGGKGAAAGKVSQFEELDMTLDHDLSLEDNAVSGLSSGKAASGDSAVDLSGKRLDDDDVVLGGSGAGSDITIGGDSGISLVDPADSGLSLETPLNLSSGDESLELGEDDLLGFSTDTDAGSMKSEDDFQLTPMDDGADGDDSESGSQVIALDTESEGDEAATMVASGGAGVAAMLDEDMSTDAGLGLPAGAMMPVGADMAMAAQADGLGGGLLAAAALPEAPYSIWNVISLVVCSLLLILVGMMMYDMLRNMWSWDSVHPVNSALMDTILGLFEK